MARRALRPVDKINQTARKIGSGIDLSRRIPVSEAQDEIGRLAQTFNDMLERLENFFIQVRQFSSDASHELRTPLTVLKGQSELVLRKIRSPEEYQEVISSNLEEINYMSKILEDLFYLSKADEAEIQYLCTGAYNSQAESGILWNDPEIGIDWPFENPILSAKDEHAQSLSQWLDSPDSANFTF